MGKALFGNLKPFFFLLLTFSFLHLGPPFLSYLHHNLFLNASLAYYLLVLLLLGPQVVNYHFTLSSHINFWIYRFRVSRLTHETFKLGLRNTLNMSKIVRVYFGVLHMAR